MKSPQFIKKVLNKQLCELEDHINNVRIGEGSQTHVVTKCPVLFLILTMLLHQSDSCCNIATLSCFPANSFPIHFSLQCKILYFLLDNNLNSFVL